MVLTATSLAYGVSRTIDPCLGGRCRDAGGVRATKTTDGSGMSPDERRHMMRGLAAVQEVPCSAPGPHDYGTEAAPDKGGVQCAGSEGDGYDLVMPARRSTAAGTPAPRHAA